MYVQKHLNEKTLMEAEHFVVEAILDVMKKIQRAEDLNEEVKGDLLSKLLNTNLVLGGLRELFNSSKVEELYSEIELMGDEKILLTTINLIRYSAKLDNEPKTSWMHRANQLSQLRNLKYLPNENLLNIPAEYLHFPYYDPKRSRFFNTATLYTEIVLSLNVGIKEYLKSKHGIVYVLDYDSIQLGYENYARWEAKYPNSELKLPGFQLTNQQMYFLAFANSYFTKYHSTIPFYQLQALNLQFTYYHVFFKARPEFRETFQCDDLDENETQQFEIFLKKFNTVVQAH